jgi:putative membrane protein
MMYWGNGMNGWAMAFMGLGNLLFWGLLLAGVVLLVRRPAHTGAAPAPRAAVPTPQQVLADRFARGEIDQDEYEARLRVLDDTPPRRPEG